LPNDITKSSEKINVKKRLVDLENISYSYKSPGPVILFPAPTRLRKEDKKMSEPGDQRIGSGFRGGVPPLTYMKSSRRSLAHEPL
jgi:hypothetical protein